MRGKGRGRYGRLGWMVNCLLYMVALLAWPVGALAAEPGGAVDLEQARERVSPVSVAWKFHAGNDPAWAKPEFDDRGWNELNPMKDWDAQGFTVEREQAWFRFRVIVPAKVTGLVLQMPGMAKNYQIFADGAQVGQVGAMPPERGGLASGATRVYTLPVKTSAAVQVMTIALRFWRPEEFAWHSTDRLPAPVLVGTPEALLPQFARARMAALLGSSGMTYTFAVIQLPILVAALLLLYLTRQRFYVWFALYMSVELCDLLVYVLSRHFAWDFRAVLGLNILLDFAGSAALAIFLGGYLGLRRSRWIWLAILLDAAAEMGPVLVPFHLPVLSADIIYFVFSLTSNLVLLWLMVRAWRAGEFAAKLFLVPFLLSAGIADVTNFGYIFVEMHMDWVEGWLPPNLELFAYPFSVTLSDAANVVALFGFLAILVYRFARTSREEQRLSAALRAAHEIQAELVPGSATLSPRLKAEVAYLAAEEVGGDFCQILPRRDGSFLVVIGDVSGKGLQAAMVGALTVGALRSLVQELLEPAAVLSRMNNVIVSHEHQGFVTCLCLLIAPNGEMVAANAGHLPPYLNGMEMESEPELPLGMAAGLQYGQRRTRLPAEARLTLLSDGVLEARDRTGSLFGFERTLAISRETAQEIAMAAQRFGQMDDITVVTLDWSWSESRDDLAVEGGMEEAMDAPL